MKLVTYLVRNQELRVLSQVGRLGILLQEDVVDVELAEQWLMEHRSELVSTSISKEANGLWIGYDPDQLLQLQEKIRKEEYSRLQIEGEPVSIPREETELLDPIPIPEQLQLLGEDRLISVADWVSHQGIIRLPEKDTKILVTPSIGGVWGGERLLGYVLLTQLQEEEEERITMGMGSYLVTSDELQDQAAHIQIRVNGQTMEEVELGQIDHRFQSVLATSGQNRAELVIWPLMTIEISAQNMSLIEIEEDRLGLLCHTMGGYVFD